MIILLYAVGLDSEVFLLYCTDQLSHHREVTRRKPCAQSEAVFSHIQPVHLYKQVVPGLRLTPMGQRVHLSFGWA